MSVCAKPKLQQPLFARLSGEPAGFARFPEDHRRNTAVFLQGEPARALFYVEKGLVKLSVLSPTGKEAVTAILRDGDFFGEDCLSGQQERSATALCLTGCRLLRLPRHAVLDEVHSNPAFAQYLLAHLLFRSQRLESDLVDQLLNNSEKRLARCLLLLAGPEEGTARKVPRISQETLAELIGTTRSRISFFLNRFRKRGWIEYDREIRVRRALAGVLDGPPAVFDGQPAVFDGRPAVLDRRASVVPD